MQTANDRYNQILDAVIHGELPATVTLWDIKRQKGRTAAASVLMIKALLGDFGVGINGPRAISACEEASATGSIDEAICSHICDLYGDENEEFAERTLAMFTKILIWCKGFGVDWKCFEADIESWMNADHLLKKYGLKVIFTKIINGTFDITLQDLDSGATLEKSTITYSANRHFIPTILEAVNKMIASRDIVFISAWEGDDSYSYVLFEMAELERLNAKYGDVGRLIHWTRRIDWNQEPAYPYVELYDDGSPMKLPMSPVDDGTPYPPDTLTNRAVRIRLRGDWTNPVKFLLKDTQICREKGDKRGLQRDLGCLAAIYRDRGSFQNALKALREEEALCRELGDVERLRFCLDSQASVLKRIGS